MLVDVGSRWIVCPEFKLTGKVDHTVLGAILCAEVTLEAGNPEALDFGLSWVSLCFLRTRWHLKVDVIVEGCDLIREEGSGGLLYSQARYCFEGRFYR